MSVAEKTKIQSVKVGNGVGKRYRAMHILPGVVGYPENPNIGTILVTREALANMRPSFIGKPVVNVDHSDLSPEELFNFSKEDLEEIAVGVVSDVGIDSQSGWDYVDMIIWDDDTIRNIDERGYSVSNAYDVTDEGPGGMENQIPYDHELKGAEYLHMAIVPNPRYKRARIFANSISKPGGKSMGIKLFNKKQPEKKVVKNMEPDEGMEVGDAVFIDKETGEEIPAEELLNAYRAQMEADATPEKTSLNAEDEVDVDGNKVKVADMYNAYKNQQAQNADGEEGDEPDMENAELPTDTAAEDVVDESLQNTRKNSAPKKKPVNGKLKTAVKNSESEFTVKVNTRRNRIEEGRKRYGSPVKQEAKS